MGHIHPRPAWRRRLERVLWCVGALLLAWVAWGWADGELYQRRQERLLTEALRSQARAATLATEAGDEEGLRVATGAGVGDPATAGGAAEGAAAGALDRSSTGAPAASPGRPPRVKPSTARLPSVTRAASVSTMLARMEVPRLDLRVMVADGVDNQTLRRAVGHIPGTARLGSGGNVGIAGHRDGFFRPLKDVRVGDEVLVTTTFAVSSYLVEWTQVVSPESSEVLTPTAYPALTLVTCYPFYYVGDAPDRFVVRARLVESRAPRPGDARLAAGR